MIKRAELLNWLRRQLMSEPHCKLLVLRFFGKPDDIEQFVVRKGSSPKLLVEVDTLCDSIINECETQGRDHGGLTKFRLYSFAGEGKTGAKATTLLKTFYPVEEEEDNEGSEVVAESAGLKGRDAQIMRHHETMFRQYAGANADIYRTQRAEIESLRDEKKTMMDKYMELISTLESLKSQALARKLAEEEALRKAQLFNGLVEKLGMFIPLLANKVMGAPMMPGAPNPEKEMLRAFLYSVKPEQFQVFMGVLDEAQRAPIIMLYEQLNKEEEEKKLQAANKLTGAAPSPRLAEENKAAAE